MKLEITKDVFANFHPKFSLGLIVVKGLQNNIKVKESKHLLSEVEELVQLTFHKETIKNHNLIAPWAVAQQEFGSKAKHYNTSVERLLRKVIRKKKVATNDVLNNLLSYVALKYIVPVGVDDRDRINGDITFSVAMGKERARIIKRLQKKALYYRDQKNILGTKLDYWKSAKTKITPKTRNAIIHIEALPPISRAKLNQILSETKNLVESFTGGKAQILVLDKKKKIIKV